MTTIERILGVPAAEIPEPLQSTLRYLGDDAAVAPRSPAFEQHVLRAFDAWVGRMRASDPDWIDRITHHDYLPGDSFNHH